MEFSRRAFLKALGAVAAVVALPPTFAKATRKPAVTGGLVSESAGVVFGMPYVEFAPKLPDGSFGPFRAVGVCDGATGTVTFGPEDGVDSEGVLQYYPGSK